MKTFKDKKSGKAVSIFHIAPDKGNSHVMKWVNSHGHKYDTFFVQHSTGVTLRTPGEGREIGRTTHCPKGSYLVYNPDGFMFPAFGKESKYTLISKKEFKSQYIEVPETSEEEQEQKKEEPAEGE